MVHSDKPWLGLLEGKENPYVTLPFVGKMKSSRRVVLPQKLVEILIGAKDSGMEVVPSKN